MKMSSNEINKLLYLGVALTFAAITNTANAQGQALFPACPDKASVENVHGLPEGYTTPCLAIVVYGQESSPSDRAKSVNLVGASLRRDLNIVNGAAVLVPNERALLDIVNESSVKAFYPDRQVHAIGRGSKKSGGGAPPPTDQTIQIIPSGVKAIGLADQLELEGNDAVSFVGVGVAIIDTGLDLEHRDLNVADTGWSIYSDAVDGACVSGSTDCNDDHGHGTHVGGIVAAINNDMDVVGVAPDATLYPVKVLDSQGSGYDSGVLLGLQWVLDNSTKIQVANMSLGGDGPCVDTIYGYKGELGNDPTIFEELIMAGITVVVAAGNDRDIDVKDLSPASCEPVITVGSVLAEDGSSACRFVESSPTEDMMSYFSSAGEGVDVFAPGERTEHVSRGCGIQFDGILSLQMGEGTTRKAGTSMAAPHVAGLAARLIQEKGLNSVDTRVDDLTNLIMDSSIDNADSDLVGRTSHSKGVVNYSN